MLRTFLLLLVGVLPAVQPSPREIRKPTEAAAPQKKAWDILWAGAHDTNVGRRSEAVRALGLLPAYPTVVQLGESALHDKEAAVRAAAATALGEMRSTASIPKLEKAMSDKNVSVALAAARSLLLMKNDTGYDVYYAVLTGKRKSSEGWIAGQLGQFYTLKKLEQLAFDQGMGVVPYAWYGLDAVHALTWKDSSSARAAAARSLSDDADPRSGQALANAAFDKSWPVRAAALRAIARRGDPSLLPQIEPAMSDSEKIVRYTAAAAVLRLTWIGQANKGKQG